MAVDPNTLVNIADDIKAAIEAEFAAGSVDLPERRFVANGDVAFDCPQLAVKVERVVADQPPGQGGPAYCVIVRTAEISIFLTREVPVMDSDTDPPTPPTVQSIEDSAEQVLADGWLVSEAIVSRRDEYAQSLKVTVLELTPVGPQGGHGGFVQRLRIQLP